MCTSNIIIIISVWCWSQIQCFLCYSSSPHRLRAWANSACCFETIVWGPVGWEILLPCGRVPHALFFFFSVLHRRRPDVILQFVYDDPVFRSKSKLSRCHCSMSITSCQCICRIAKLPVPKSEVEILPKKLTKKEWNPKFGFMFVTTGMHAREMAHENFQVPKCWQKHTKLWQT